MFVLAFSIWATFMNVLVVLKLSWILGGWGHGQFTSAAPFESW